MHVLLINGGAIFFPKTDIEAYNCFQQQKCVMTEKGLVIPKELVNYLGSWENDENLEYNYYFNNLLQKNLYWNFTTAKLEKTKTFEDGWYIWENNTTNAFKRISYFDVVDNLPYPLHKELYSFIENTKNDITEIKNLFSTLNILLEQICNTISSVPVSPGSPLNPSIQNTFDSQYTTYENTLDNIYDNLLLLQDKIKEK